jgi:valyl-tRNA synthetase
MRESLKLSGLTAEEEQLISDVEKVKQIVSGVRMVRSQKNIAPKEQLELQVLVLLAEQAENQFHALAANHEELPQQFQVQSSASYVQEQQAADDHQLDVLSD